MKTTKKALSVLLAVIMIMSSMSVCFGTFSFTASAADDTKFEAFANALKNSTDVLAQVYNKDFGSYGNTEASGSAGKTNNIVNTTTLTVNTYAQYKTLKNLVALFHEAIMASEEIGKTGSGDAATRTCTSATHMYTEFEKKLPKYGCTMTEPVVYFLKLVLDDSKARQHDNYEEKKKSLFSNPSSSTTPANHTNTLIIKAKDEAYKGYLDSIGAYTNVESTIDLGVKYIFAMTRGYYASKSGLSTYWRFHNYVGTPPSAPAYNQNSNTAAKGKVDAHATVINNFTSVSFDDLLAKVNNGTIDQFLSDFNSAVSTMETYVGGTSTYNKLFASTLNAVATQKASIQSAKSMQEYLPIVNNYKAFIAANPSYGVFTWGNGGGANNWGAFGEKGSATHAKMEADYLTFKSYYDALVAGGTILDYFVNNGDIDMQYLYNFTDNYKVYYLNDSRNAADNFYNTYKDTYKDYTTEEQSSLYSEISGYINAIGTYRSNARGGELQVINAIYNEGYVYLLNLQENLKVEINEFVLYFAENAHKSFVDLSTQDLYKKIEEVKGQLTGLNNFYNTLTYSRRDQLLGQLRTDADNMLEGLYRTLADRFTAQVNAANATYDGMKRPETLDMVTFLNLSAPIIALEDGWDKNYHPENYDDNTDNDYHRGDNNNFGIQDYLDKEGKGSLITSETRNTWSEFISDIYETWVVYRTTYGFKDYTQSHMTYEDRDVYETDEVKKETYTVTEQNLLNTIADLDTIITSDTVTNLLGSLINEDGSPLNIGVMLSDLVKGFLFKDEFINLVVQLLYPLVLGEFTKVFNDLPPEAAGMSVTYNKDFHKVCSETGLELYPDLLAGVIDANKYPEAVAMLRKAGGYDDSWTSVEILDTETGKLKLKWGIDEIEDLEEREQKFYEAFAAAAEGLKPLLMALIANKSWEPDKVTEFAHALVLNVTLTLGATGNAGYANTLVPIYEMLDVPFTSVSSIEGSNNVAYILEQILAPIFTFIEELAEAPVSTILGVLPNLVYALSFGMVKPLLNKLYTQVWYKAGVVSGGAITVTEGGVDIYIGDTIITPKEDALLPESMFAGGINSLLSYFGLSLPAIDATKLATLGELKTVSTARKATIYSGLNSGQAYTIVADKADVAYYLLSYILGLVKDEVGFTSLLGMFMTQKDENGQPIKVDDKTVPDTEAIEALTATLYDDEGLNLDEIDVGDAIAAIVELANQIEYGVDPYYWYAGENNTPLGTTAAADIYLNPNNDWTEAKAQYLYENLEGLLNSIFTMAGLDISVEGALSDAIGGLFSGKTVTALAKLLGSLDLNALLAGDAEAEAAPAIALDLNKIIKDELGVDLAGAYGKYANIAEDVEVLDEFASVNDAESFVAALTELLKPLKPVLDFILGGKDLTLIDSAITLQGYNGYDNAIIPLLEALGATPAAYTEDADTLALTLNALVGVINKITTNDPEVANDGAIYTIIDILPGVLYYISSNALSQGVDKLLTPVYAILDTIRPIYNLKLNDLLAGIEIGEEGAKKPLGLDIKNITWSFIFGLLNDLLGLDLSALAQVIYDVCDDLGVTYTSKSTLESTWKKGAYNDNFSQADMLTVVLSFVLEWITIPENGAKLDELLGTDGIVASIGTVFESVEITYGTPNWMYWFDSEEAFNEYLANPSRINTLATIDWENIGDNDWDYETAKYFAENIDVLVDKIIAMINEGKTDEEGNALPTNLKDLLSNLVNGLVNAETLNDLVGMITGLLGDIDENLIDAAGYLLDVDLAGLKNYTCTADIDSISDFINELANVLDTYAGGLINWLFFGDDYRFAKKSDETDTIVINGGLGYEKGLAMILEALGCELPEEANTKSVLGALATRVDEILADPINEVLDLLPNLVYFLNANGAGVAVDNLLKPVNALLDKLSAFGLEVNLADLLKITKEDGTEIAIDLANLSLANVVEIVEGATDLPLDAAEAILVDFCTGKITEGTYIYKMEAAREDVITILLYVALELVSDEDFAKALDEMLGTDFIAKIKEIFAPSSIEYDTPDWNYAAADNGTVDAMKYSITYPNNWNEDTAEYVTDVLLSDDFDKLIAGLIEDGKYATISELLKDKVNIFTTKTLEDLLDLIEGFLGGIDEELLKLGFILDVKLDKLVKYEVKKDIDTVQEFADELAYILGEFAPGVVEWLLLGRDFKLLVKDADGIGEGLEGDPYITISGAEGYKKGLAILLEALGCENLPSPVITEENTTAKIIKGVLTSLAARIDEILSDPIVEVIDLLPNLFYFLNTNGVAAVIKNTTAALTALSAKINVFVDVNLDVASMVNLKELLKLPKEAKLSMTNLSMAAVLEAVGMLVGLDLTKAENVLVGFALGKFEGYTSVSGDSYAKKMVYADEFDKHDLVTVVANLALLVLADEANAEFVKGLVGKDVYDVILNVLQIKEAELKKMSWQHTDKVGQSFNAMTSSENYKGYGYGPRYTEEMADYIAENIGEFVDNIIYLLGIEIEGESVDSLEEILKNLVNGNLYNSANIVAIRDALAGLLDKIAGLEVNGIVVGGYIVDVLKTSLGVDVAAVAKVEVPEFTEDKAQFITYLGNVVEPLGPILNWILTDEDIAFFAKEGEDGKPTDFIKLPGNAGYKNGIVLLLEALGCKKIVAPADLEGASGSAIVTAIAEPLLNRLDEIINNPAEELLAVLPNLIYFINSNGVDVVVKNTLNAVYTILNAIEPIAKIDLYELIGLDLETLTFEKLIDMLLKDLEIAGFKFTEIPMDTFVELTVGKLETYDSLSAEDPAYRMVYDENSASEGDMVTVLLRLVITFILTENNREVLINLLKSELGMSADAEKYVAALFKALADCTIGNQLGMDSALATIYYVYYGLDKGVGEAADGKKDLDKAWQAKLKELGYSDNKDEQSVGNLITDILDIVFNDQGNVPDDGGNDVLDKDGLASNGFLSFFQRIKIFFEEIAAFFRELFSFGK